MSAALVDVSSPLELTIHECGREICIPNKVFHFDKKQYFLVHYVIKGEGSLRIDGHDYQLKKGDAFFFPPGAEPEYHPDPLNPWTYVWVGFNGATARNILKKNNINGDNAVYHDKDYLMLDMFEKLYSYFLESGQLELRALGMFATILGSMEPVEVDQQRLPYPKQHYKAAVAFIENNYQFKITVKNIAENVGVTPNYLSAVFNDEIGMSPKRYLTEYRMKKACSLLKTTTQSIQDVANNVGYADSLHFSSEFKKNIGLAPTKYREEQR